MARDVYLKCPSCRKWLVYPATGQPYAVHCPSCAAHLRIPARPGSLWNQLAARPGLAVKLALLLLVPAVAIPLALQTPSAARTEAARVPLRTGMPAQAPAARVTKPEAEVVDVTYRDTAVDETLFGLETEKEQLAAENQELRTQFEKLANWVLASFRGKYPLPQRMVTNLRIEPVNDDFTLHPDLAELLQVTPGEKEMMDDAFVATRQTISDLEESILSITENAPDRLTLYIPPYEDEGVALKEDLYGALEATLGANRFDRMVDVAQEQLEKQYHYFGTAARTLVFEVSPPQQEGEPAVLVIKDGWIIPDGGNGRSVEVKESAVTELPRAYLAYLHHMPPNVAAYARP